MALEIEEVWVPHVYLLGQLEVTMEVRLPVLIIVFIRISCNNFRPQLAVVLGIITYFMCLLCNDVFLRLADTLLIFQLMQRIVQTDVALNVKEFF